MEIFASASHEAPAVTPINSELSSVDSACIQDIVQVLKKHNCLNRFGLTLLHDHFDLDEDELLAEINNPHCRTLLVEPIARSDLLNSSYIETAWRFDNGKPVTTCVCLAE